MNEFIRMFLRMFIQVGPYLVVFVVLGYIIKLQEKKAKEREEEQKKGIIKTHYVVKTEKILAIMFVVGTIFFACCMAMGIAQQEDTFVVCVFGFFFLVGIVGTVNMMVWKLEVNEMKLYGVQLLEIRKIFSLEILHIVRERKVLFGFM